MKMLRWSLFFLFSVCVYSQPLDVSVSAKSALLLNAENGKVLFEKNGYESAFPASVTKIATALYILETKKQALDTKITASSDAIAIAPRSKKRIPYRLEKDTAHIGIKRGEVLSIESLLYGMMLASGGDAANVLAEWTSGSIPEFMVQLNQYLNRMGCTQTHFVNPHGVHDASHVTTAYDLAKLTQRALQNPTFRKIVSSVMFTCPPTNKQPKRIFSQTNRLLKKRNASYYPFAIGVKTGYTVPAGHTLVAAAEKDGRLLIAVVMGAEKSEERFADARRMFEAGFAEQKISRQMFGKETHFSNKIEGGEKALQASLRENITIEYYPSEENEIQSKVQWHECQFPLSVGDCVGELHLVSGNQVIKKYPLFASEPLQGTFLFKVKRFCKKLF
ncbi:MAG: D-alanyl-D-alanine carboxypeptidase family protein [Chlamydiota bacterium]